MSVMPRIRFDLVRSGKDPIRFYMLNTGTGPAVVEKFSIRRDGESVVSPSVGNLSEGLAHLGLSGEFFFLIPHAGDAIAVGETLDIIRVTLTECDDAKWEILKAELRRITVLCDYASIYGEKKHAGADALGAPIE